MKYFMIALCFALAACGKSEAPKEIEEVGTKVAAKPIGLGALPPEEIERRRAELAELAEENRIKHEALDESRALKYKSGCFERLEKAKAKRDFYNKMYRVPDWQNVFIPDELCDEGGWVPYKRASKQ